MTTYLIRTNCEYSTSIEADSPEEALEKAEEKDVSSWEQAWAPMEVDSDGSEDE